MSVRMSEAEFKKISSLRLPAATKKAPADPRSGVTRSIESIRHASPVGVVLPGVQVDICWAGARLLTLNEILRIDHRVLHAYRLACHGAVRDAVMLLAKRSHGLRFDGPVEMVVRRTGRRLVDTDGLYASFKFIIDGFRLAGVIRDDDPLNIVRMSHEQKLGERCIGISIVRAVDRVALTDLPAVTTGIAMPIHQRSALMSNSNTALSSSVELTGQLSEVARSLFESLGAPADISVMAWFAQEPCLRVFVGRGNPLRWKGVPKTYEGFPVVVEDMVVATAQTL